MNNRPMVITVLCIVGFVSFGLSLIAMPALFESMTLAHGTGYALFWVVSVLLTVAALVGFWRMKKWGVYLYTALFGFGIIIGLITNVPFTLLSVFLALAIIGVGFGNIKRMS